MNASPVLMQSVAEPGDKVGLPPIAISNIDALRRATRFGLLDLSGRHRFTLRLPMLTDAETAAWQARFNAVAGLCGCLPAALSAIAGISWQFGLRHDESLQSWSAAALSASIVVAAALTVKLAVMLFASAARWRLGRVLCALLTKRSRSLP